MKDEEHWDLIIKPRKGWLDLNLADLWKYRDLILMFVKRDIVVVYKQTILGPLWFLLQPLLSTAIFTIIFGKVARISTDEIPPFLFYMAGTTAWSYFSACITETSNTFVANSGIFGKVYFPRMTVPISVVISNIFKFLMQFMLFVIFYCFFWMNGSPLKPTMTLLVLPLLLLQMAILGLGVGMLVSSMVTKYRDLNLLMTFGVQLWMYATPVIYPLSQVPDEYKSIYLLNPMATIIQKFKFAFFGIGDIDSAHWLMGWGITAIIFFTGMLLFHRVEKSFMDTV